MRATMKFLGICFISLCWSNCKDVSKFDAPRKSAQAKEIKPSEDQDEDAEAAHQQALEPVPIGGAYLACRYEVVKSNQEVWCRLEENGQPVLVKSMPTLENWVFTQNEIPYDATPISLDPSTGWQWAIKIPQDNKVEVSLDIFLNGVRYHFNASISTMPPDSDDGISASASLPLQDKRYAYGKGASFVVDNNPFSLSAPESCLPPADKATVPDPSLPDLRIFLKAYSFTFPFKVVNENSLLTITVDAICGQTQPLHYAKLRGMGMDVRLQIPIGAKKLVVAKSAKMVAGDYEVEVRFIPRSLADFQKQEKVAFGKLILESSGELIPGRAYANDKK